MTERSATAGPTGLTRESLEEFTRYPQSATYAAVREMARELLAARVGVNADSRRISELEAAMAERKPLGYVTLAQHNSETPPYYTGPLHRAVWAKLEDAETHRKWWSRQNADGVYVVAEAREVKP